MTESQETNSSEDYLDFLWKELYGSSGEVLKTPTRDPVVAQKDSEKKQIKRNPFKFLEAYGPEDQLYYFGREAEAQELYRRCFNSPLTLVYGESGSGKTSLIRCGLSSQLPPGMAYIIHVRSLHEPIMALQQALTPFMDGIEGWQNQPPLEQLKICQKYHHRTLLIVFDQFEEIFTLHPLETRKIMAKLIFSMVHSDLDLRVLLVLREEYLAKLSEFRRALPNIFLNSIWLPKMSSEVALRVIEEVMKVGNLRIEDGVAQRVVEAVTLTQNLVDLPVMQILLERLYQQALKENPTDPCISLDETDSSGILNQHLTHYVAEVIKKSNHVEFARKLLTSLVTEQGTRQPLTQSQLLQNLGREHSLETIADLKQEISYLAEARVIREDAENEFIELSHDVIAQIIREWMDEEEVQFRKTREKLEKFFEIYSKELENKKINPNEYLLRSRDFIELSPLMRLLNSPDDAKLRTFLLKSERYILQQKKIRKYKIITSFSVVSLTAILMTFLYVRTIITEHYANSLESQKHQLADAYTVFRLMQASPHQALYKVLEIFSELKEKNTAIEPQLLSILIQAVYETREILSIPLDNEIKDSQNKWKSLANRNFINPLAYSSNRKLIANTDSNHDIWLRNENGASISGPWKGHNSAVSSLAFSGDGQNVLSADVNGGISVWSLQGQKQHYWKAHEEQITGLAIHPHKPLIASSSMDGSVRFWDFQGNALTQPLKRHRGWVNCIAFNHDGSLLASGGRDGRISLWTANGNFIRDFATNQGGVISLDFHPNGKLLASGQWKKTIGLWDLNGNPQRAPLNGHSQSVWSVKFSPDGQLLASGSLDHTIRLWEVSGHPVDIPMVGHQANIMGLVFSEDGKTLLSTSIDMTLKTWKVLPNKWKIPTSYVQAVSDSSGEQVATAGKNGEIQIWDTQTHELQQNLKTSCQEIYVLNYSPDKKWLAVGGLNCPIYVYDRNGKNILKLPSDFKGFGATYALDFSPNSQTLIAGGLDGKLGIWDFQHEKQLSVWSLHNKAISDLAITDDGNHVYTASFDHFIKKTSLKSGISSVHFKGHKEQIWSVALSPDNKILASAGLDGAVCVWDANTGKILDFSQEHQGGVKVLRFNPLKNSDFSDINDKSEKYYLASVGEDNKIRLWTVENSIANQDGDHPYLTLLSTLPALHTDRISSLSFSPDGKSMFSGSHDGYVIQWPIGTNEWLKEGCQLTQSEVGQKNLISFCSNY